MGWLLALAAGMAAAAVPLEHLSASRPDADLAAVMTLHSVSEDTPIDPDQLWAAPAAPPQAGLDRLTVVPGFATVGRVQLFAGRAKDVYVVQVPSSRIDRVQVWFRLDGGAWRSAEAGDMVPLSRWPFFGQFPGFSIPVNEHQVDLIVTLHNQGAIDVPVLIKTEKAYHEGRLRQANLSGLVMGMGLMVAVVCLISALTQRARPSWVLFAFSAWSVLTVSSINGYAAIWLLPDLPWLNDGAKLVTSMVMAGLLLWTVAAMLDRLPVRGVRWLGPLAAAAGLLLGVGLVAMPGTGPWRLPAGLCFSAACIVASLGLCLASRRQGGRHVGLVAAAVVAFTATIVLRPRGGSMWNGLDWLSASSATLLFLSSLLLRHAQFARVRYGRDVLGRAAVSANRDPLTALWSYEGFQQRHAEIALREAAGQGRASMMLFLLPGLASSSADHGFELAERALVRFAAVLQSQLGDEWVLGRLSKTRFAAISTVEIDGDRLNEIATQVLSECARLQQPLGPVSDFDLRIACRDRDLAGASLKDLVRELDEAGHALAGGRRIVIL